MPNFVIPVFDRQQGRYLMMNTKRALHNLEFHPERFRLDYTEKDLKMSSKTLTRSKPNTLKMKDVKSVRGKGVQKFSMFQEEGEHRKLTDYYDKTIYIVKIEPITSETYGTGYKLWFKEQIKAKQTLTAGVFSQYVLPKLDTFYELTHQGKLLSLDSPCEVTIRKAGNSYTLE